MLAPVYHALTSRHAGPLASMAALFLALALAATLTAARRTETDLQARLAQLDHRAQTLAAAWRAKAAACEAARPLQAAAPATPGVERIAERLASQPPPGFDACARMESADAAVLGALK